MRRCFTHFATIIVVQIIFSESFTKIKKSSAEETFEISLYIFYAIKMKNQKLIFLLFHFERDFLFDVKCAYGIPDHRTLVMVHV